jgi:hypothetical protein
MFFSKPTNGTTVGSVGSSIFSLVGFSNTGSTNSGATIINNGTVVCNVNGSTVYNLTSIVLTPGTWIITNRGQLQGVVSGYSRHSISTTSATIDSNCVNTMNVDYNVTEIDLSFSRILSVANNTTVYATAVSYHVPNPEQTRTCFSQLQAVKIV